MGNQNSNGSEKQNEYWNERDNDGTIDNSGVALSHKQVSFSDRVSVVLIPSRADYDSIHLTKKLWWTSEDFLETKALAELELLGALSLEENISSGEAVIYLYQPRCKDGLQIIHVLIGSTDPKFRSQLFHLIKKAHKKSRLDNKLLIHSAESTEELFQKLDICVDFNAVFLDHTILHHTNAHSSSSSVFGENGSITGRNTDIIAEVREWHAETCVVIVRLHSPTPTPGTSTTSSSSSSSNSHINLSGCGSGIGERPEHADFFWSLEGPYAGDVEAQWKELLVMSEAYHNKPRRPRHHHHQHSNHSNHHNNHNHDNHNQDSHPHSQHPYDQHPRPSSAERSMEGMSQQESLASLSDGDLQDELLRVVDEYSQIPRTVDALLSNQSFAWAVFDREPPFTIVRVSPLWSDLCGYSAEEAVGKDIGFTKGTKTDMRKLSFLKIAIENGTKISTFLINYRKDGREFISYIRGVCLDDTEQIINTNNNVADDDGNSEDLLEEQEGSLYVCVYERVQHL